MSKTEWIAAYVGLGSNLDNPLTQLHWAIEQLRSQDNVRNLICSDIVQSEAMGPPGQPDFLNAVCGFESTLSAEALLDFLHGLEAQRGRVRKQRWGPRTLDLDLLIFGNRVSCSESLRLPHPGVHERSFVLYPLAQIAPELLIPGKGRVAELVLACDISTLKPIDAAGAAGQ